MATVTIADHMRVEALDPSGLKNEVNKNHISVARFEHQVSQHVSMVGANNVKFDVTMHTDSMNATDSLIVFVQQSNDLSNWYELSTTDNPSVKIQTGDTMKKTGEAKRVFMAYARVVFALDDESSPGGTVANGVFATVSGTLNTSSQ